MLLTAYMYAGSLVSMGNLEVPSSNVREIDDFLRGEKWDLAWGSWELLGPE